MSDKDNDGGDILDAITRTSADNIGPIEDKLNTLANSWGWWMPDEGYINEISNAVSDSKEQAKTVADTMESDEFNGDAAQGALDFGRKVQSAADQMRFANVAKEMQSIVERSNKVLDYVRSNQNALPGNHLDGIAEGLVKGLDAGGSIIVDGLKTFHLVDGETSVHLLQDINGWLRDRREGEAQKIYDEANRRFSDILMDSQSYDTELNKPPAWSGSDDNDNGESGDPSKTTTIDPTNRISRGGTGGTSNAATWRTSNITTSWPNAVPLGNGAYDIDGDGIADYYDDNGDGIPDRWVHPNGSRADQNAAGSNGTRNDSNDSNDSNGSNGDNGTNGEDSRDDWQDREPHRYDPPQRDPNDPSDPDNRYDPYDPYDPSDPDRYDPNDPDRYDPNDYDPTHHDVPDRDYTPHHYDVPDNDYDTGSHRTNVDSDMISGSSTGFGPHGGYPGSTGGYQSGFGTSLSGGSSSRFGGGFGGGFGSSSGFGGGAGSAGIAGGLAGAGVGAGGVGAGALSAGVGTGSFFANPAVSAQVVKPSMSGATGLAAGLNAGGSGTAAGGAGSAARGGMMGAPGAAAGAGDKGKKRQGLGLMAPKLEDDDIELRSVGMMAGHRVRKTAD